MNTTELIDKKQELDKAITKLLEDFRKETGLSVQDIEVSTYLLHGYMPEYKVKSRVDI